MRQRNSRPLNGTNVRSPGNWAQGGGEKGVNMRTISKIADLFRGHKKSVVFDQRITRIPALETRAHSVRSIRTIDMQPVGALQEGVASPTASRARPKVRREPYSLSSEISIAARIPSKPAADLAGARSGGESTAKPTMQYLLDLSKLPLAEGLTKRTRGQTPVVGMAAPADLNSRVMAAKFAEIERPIH